MTTDKFIRDLNFANYLASRQAGTAPTYLAHPTAGGSLWTFYCNSCHRAHWHSPGPGHVVAHWDGNAHPAGYFLLLAPFERPAPDRPRSTPVGDVFPRYPATA